MSNRYFDFPASLARFLRRTLARAEDVNARFDEVSAGFDTVQTEMDQKAPVHAPDLTGNVSIGGNLTVTGTASAASPGPVSVSNDLVPTTQWVQNVVGAASTLLPTQAGKSGLYLSTNGSFASWKSARTGGYQLASDSVVDVNPDAELLDTGNSDGLLFRLPDATTLQLNKVYHVNLRSTQGLMDYTNRLLWANVTPTVFMVCLIDNTTQAGVWRFLPYDTGGSSRTLPGTSLSLYSVSSTYATSASGASGVMVGSNRVLVCGCGFNLSRAVLLDVGYLSLSLVQQQQATAPQASATWSATFDVGSGSYIHVWAISNFLYGRVVTISGDTVTQGSDVLLRNDVSAGSTTQLGAGGDGASVVVVFTTATDVIAIALTATGTTLNVGTALTIYSPGTLTTTTQQLNAVAMNAGSFLVAGSVTSSSSYSLFAAELSCSGNSLSLLGTLQTQALNSSTRCWVTKLTSTLALATASTSNSAATPSARTISVSGSGATINAQTLLSVAAKTVQVHCAVSPTLAVVDGNASRQIVTISGTSVSAGVTTSGTGTTASWVRLSSNRVYSQRDILDVSESGSPIVVSHTSPSVNRDYRPTDDVWALPEDRVLVLESNGEIQVFKNRSV